MFKTSSEMWKKLDSNIQFLKNNMDKFTVLPTTTTKSTSETTTIIKTEEKKMELLENYAINEKSTILV